MSALRATSAHPASNAEAWERGWVRRARNFHEVQVLAESWRPEENCTCARVTGLVANGTPGLSLSERAVLTVYASTLNNLRLRNGRAYVWISIEKVAGRLNLGVRTIQAANQALEAKGFLIRDYRRDNRRLTQEAIDLRPLLARLGELEGEIQQVSDAEMARRAAYGISVLQEDTGWDESTGALEQSPDNEVESVQEADAPSARSLLPVRQASPAAEAERTAETLKPIRTRSSSQGSPRGDVSSGRTSSARAVSAKALQDQLAAALELCPELQQYVAAGVVENPSSATPADFARICDAAQALLPEPERNNGQTALWGIRRHGLLVVPMLALSLKGRRIGSPNAYFAGLALSDASRSLDFTFNLANLLRGQAKLPTSPRPPAARQQAAKPAVSDEAAASVVRAPGSDDPVWVSIAAELRQLVTTGKFGSYCERIGFHGISNGSLRLSAQPAFAADFLRKDAAMSTALRDAVIRAGHEDLTVEIRNRSIHQLNPYADEADA